MEYKVVVVGAGPAGCTAAGLIAAEGHRVLVVEEHGLVGEPVNCSGLVSPRTLDLAGTTTDIILNRIRGFCLHSPGGKRLSVTGNKDYALVIDRAAFDRQLAKKARESGAELLTWTRAAVKGRSSGGIELSLRSPGGRQVIKAPLVLGSDGANSRVARWLGLPRPQEMIRVFAAEVELESPNPEKLDIFIGRELAPGWFGWVIPVDRKRARVGIGAGSGGGRPAALFKKLVEVRPERFRGMKVERFTGGIIPIGAGPRIYGPNVMLVGDAACQTKPLSGGGIYLGLRGAEACAGAALEALAGGDFSEKSLSRYQAAWEAEIGGEMRGALLRREIFKNLRDWETDLLVRFFNRPMWRGLIANYGDIDYTSVLGDRLASSRPWLGTRLAAGLKKVLAYSFGFTSFEESLAKEERQGF